MSQVMYDTLIRVEPGHPNQCQAIRPGVGTQCCFKAIDNGIVCLMHGGIHVINSRKAKSLSQYRLGKFQARMREFAESPALRSVDEEISILRMVLESIYEQCNENMDLLLYSQKIGELVQDITRCVIVADRLATKSGMLIGRGEAVTIANQVIDIITKHISDEKTLLSIAEEISDAFLSTGTNSIVTNVPATTKLVNRNESMDQNLLESTID